MLRAHWLSSRRARNCLLLTSTAILLLAQAAHAQLRIVSYNTAGGPRTGIDVILRAIGEEERNGIARPIDVLMLQEQTSFTTTTQSILDILNSPSMYGAGAYSLVGLNGDTTGSGRPGLIYKTSTIQLNEETTIALGTADTNGQPRQTLRYHLQPIGYDSSFEFYAYNSHYKAEEGTTNESRRLLEAQIIRTDADDLGDGKHLIFAGDFNTYHSTEPGFQTLIAPGPGQAHDPIRRLGAWSDKSGFADVHTQAPCLGPSGCGGLTTGGMDDRFDFQLISGELQDGIGLDYLQNSYRAFGNGGNVFNNNINAGCSTMSGCINAYEFTGVTSHTKAQILNALHTVSDHLPVVADYTFTGSAPPSDPVIIARWTFETSGSSISGSATSFGPIAPEVGSGAARGNHNNASTWSSPAGNGSPESFSSTQWTGSPTANNYYQFQFSTEGVADITVSFDHAGSSTGPRDFRIDYSTDGITFLPTGDTYSVQASAVPNEWNSTTYRPIHSFFFDLSELDEIEDEATLFLRLVQNSTTAINGGTVAAGGTSRVDNVTIFYNALAGIPGDHNGDEVVDILDYVVWRADPDNNGGPGGYDEWRGAYGTGNGNGSGNANAGGAAVPEPSAAVLAVLGVCLMGVRRIKLGA